MAVGCIEALKDLHMRVPEDVAVVGYDDREIAQYTHPPLTTLVLPHFEMGSEAVAYLVEHATRPLPRPTQIKIECPLVERKSVNGAGAGHGNEPEAMSFR
jgi:LacI family transcriptional regulator